MTTPSCVLPCIVPILQPSINFAIQCLPPYGISNGRYLFIQSTVILI